MAWSFSSDKPVYIQIAHRITASVLSGEYKAGEQIPTVRQLAMEAAVNPNTVQHAFLELEKEGIIVSQGTVGRYVTEDNAIIEEARERIIGQIIEGFAEKIARFSNDKEQILKMVGEALK